MSRMNELRAVMAQNTADARALAQGAVRDFIEGKEVDLHDVVAALGVLGLTTATLETALALHSELAALKVPSPAELSKLQQEQALAKATLSAEIKRFDSAGVRTMWSEGGGWGTTVSPLIRKSWDAERAARFALDAAVNKVARRDELVEQIAVLIGERPAPKPAPRPQLKVEVNGARVEDGFLRVNRPSKGEVSKRIVRGPDGKLAIEEFVRKNEPEGNPERRPASEICKRFYKGREVPLD